MNSQAVVWCAVVVLGMISVVVWWLLLRLGVGLTNRTKSARHGVSRHRFWLAAIQVAAIEWALAAALYYFAPANWIWLALATLLALGAALLLPALAISWTLQTSLARSFLASFLTLIVPLMVVVLLGPVMAKLLYDHYVVPTNAMAPSILGNHWTAACEKCGAPAFCSPIDTKYSFANDFQPDMICENFHVTRPTIGDRGDVGGRDRIVVAPHQRPKRWDLIVFKFPGDPSQRYVMRLVGLPGETITIDDGHLWANGRKLSPPVQLAEIEYISTLHGEKGWGAPDKPARLGKDEYFVLGDFSPSSKDSRFWERGAEGHPPYAVPESHLRGVVQRIYWPPDRWRTF